MQKIDFLTGLNTMAFLEQEYTTYIQDYPKTYMIAIDFAKLKHLNDNFGHAVGDVCLKIFADLSKKYFTDSLLIRRSGDEFIFVTYFSQEEIEEKLISMIKEIEIIHTNNAIPTAFKFNCGIKETKENLKTTLLKADITMYSAKTQNLIYKLYDKNLYINFKHSKEFVGDVDKIFDQNEITYVFQKIYSIDKIEQIKEIYTRNNDNSLFDRDHYKILSLNYRFKKIDLINLENLFKNYYHIFQNDKVMINIHYQSVLSIENNFIELIKDLTQSYNININNIILSINVTYFNEDIDLLKEKMENLRKLGFKICLDKYSYDGIALNLFETTDIDYIKIGKQYLECCMLNPRKKIFAKNIFNIFDELGTKPIFTNIETLEEHNFVANLSNKSYVKGYYYSKEEKIK